MRVVVVGAGPVGLVSGAALAQRGHQVVVVDRDPQAVAGSGPERPGVMQFTHPHFFRSVVREQLQELFPAAWDAVLAAGARPVLPPGTPPRYAGFACRRWVFERAVRNAASALPGLSLQVGEVGRVVVSQGRVTGVEVDGTTVDADLVVCAAGRTGLVADDARRPGEGGPCGVSYVSRMYRVRQGVDEPAHLGSVAPPGYLAILFPQDDRTLSLLFVRATDDRALAGLRHEAAFQAAAQAVPLFAPWADPARADPLTPVLKGGLLTNTYRSQLAPGGGPVASGLLFVGDAVSTTNPAAGRGVGLGLRQVAELVRLLDEGSDPATAAQSLDAWCLEHIKPWYDEHVHWDACLLAEWGGADLADHARLPSYVLCAAGQEDPGTWMPVVGPYLAMDALPSSLAVLEGPARALLGTGWRPSPGDAPSRDVLADLVGSAAGHLGEGARRRR